MVNVSEFANLRLLASWLSYLRLKFVWHIDTMQMLTNDTALHLHCVDLGTLLNEELSFLKLLI